MWKATNLDLGSGRSLHAVQKGAGRDVLLLHGAMTTHHDWLAGPAEVLSEGARITAIDRPGHGLSRRPRFVGTPRDQAAQIAGALDRLDVGPCVVGTVSSSRSARARRSPGSCAKAASPGWRGPATCCIILIRNSSRAPLTGLLS